MLKTLYFRFPIRKIRKALEKTTLKEVRIIPCNTTPTISLGKHKVKATVLRQGDDGYLPGTIKTAVLRDYIARAPKNTRAIYFLVIPIDWPGTKKLKTTVHSLGIGYRHLLKTGWSEGQGPVNGGKI